jgi:hypothetical protein
VGVVYVAGQSLVRGIKKTGSGQRGARPSLPVESRWRMPPIGTRGGTRLIAVSGGIQMHCHPFSPLVGRTANPAL